jgi:hypothetical protein
MELVVASAIAHRPCTWSSKSEITFDFLIQQLDKQAFC